MQEGNKEKALALVAPLTGSVDRNRILCLRDLPLTVAPLTGSVDRNTNLKGEKGDQGESLPSRGAWIEINIAVRSRPLSASSLPSRGAWIEILPWLAAMVGLRRSPHGERG